MRSKEQTEIHMDIENYISRLCDTSSFRNRIMRFLQRICAIDTSPSPDVALLGEREKQVFHEITRELHTLSFQHTRLLKKSISPNIENHPAYSRPYYTVTDTHPDELSVQETYRNRYNLVYMLDHPRSERGRNVALNAHIDVVAPFSPPKIQGKHLYGRGSADDKGNVAIIIGALAVLDELRKKQTITLNNDMTAMFVIDEETGGNGSLDLALDKDLKRRYDSILILECAGNKIHPANRGAVYFTCETSFLKNDALIHGSNHSLPEAFVYVILEMEKEGDAIREESNHPLFPHRPVQTCNGILGPFGKHPSTICGEVTFILKGCDGEKDVEKVKKVLIGGLSKYTAKYGDKTETKDPAAGKSRLERHFDCFQNGKGELEITVYGLSGHAGSLFQNDAAITKWAYMTKNLLELKYKDILNFTMELAGTNDPNTLVLEGSQGFLPTHEIEEIKKRLASAFSRGIQRYIRDTGLHPDSIHYDASFNKLHNDAFACDPASVTMKSALKAGIRAGIITQENPIVGWDVSCDARLFAKEYPSMPVITTGAGNLIDAHSDHERIYLPDLFDAICFTALFLLLETGSLH